jgi:hypothetical protein
MTNNMDPNPDFIEFDFPKFEHFEFKELMFDIDGLLDFSFDDFVN